MSSSPKTKRFIFLVPLLLGTCLLQAHTINYALENAPVHRVVGYYLLLGFQHILPGGFDHILFITGLCLLSTRVQTILWQATAFTVAHSITLILSMQKIVAAPPGLVEPIIALTILFIAVENLLLDRVKAWRILIVFLFGLVHGLGFASALAQKGLPPHQFYTSLLAFNAGVEVGQIAVIALFYTLVILPFGKGRYYKRKVVYPLSIFIALMAAFWLVQRI